MSEEDLPPIKKYGYLKIIREKDDYLEIEGQKLKVLRISAGGLAEERSYYCTFRGDPREIIDLLEECLWGLRVKYFTSQTDPGQGKS